MPIFRRRQMCYDRLVLYKRMSGTWVVRIGRIRCQDLLPANPTHASPPGPGGMPRLPIKWSALHVPTVPQPNQTEGPYILPPLSHSISTHIAYRTRNEIVYKTIMAPMASSLSTTNSTNISPLPSPDRQSHIINIFFGLAAVVSSIIMIWQGRRMWRSWHDRMCNPNPNSRSAPRQCADALTIRAQYRGLRTCDT